LGKHVAYRPSKESGYSRAELADMHLVQGKRNGDATDAVRRYEYTENSLFGVCQILVLSFLPNVRLRETGKFDGMRWDVRSPCSIRKSQSSQIIFCD
jgi:hypothetical protein